MCSSIRIPARRSTSPVGPGTGWPGDPATPQTPVAADAARGPTLAGEAGSIAELNAQISVCRACPRLVSWREEVAVVKRRAFADQPYWGRPVPGWGSERPRLLIVGLAPAAHGANRTGRMFTGDRSGDQLYAALHRAGLVSSPISVDAADGLRANQIRIVAPVRCAPPGNAPTPAERDDVLALAGCRMAVGVATMSVPSLPWAGSPGRSRCGCREHPEPASRGSATASSPSCRPACVCSAATTRASKTCSPVG